MTMWRPCPRFTIRRMMALIAITGIVLALAKYVFIENRPRDFLFAAISAADGHFTVYANGYCESRFRSLHAGMTLGEVEVVMGSPITQGKWQVPTGNGTSTAGEGILDDIWCYSRPGKANGNYWRREVLFRNGAVYCTESDYYLD